MPEDELVAEIHLKQPGFAYSTCAFTKTSVRIRNFKETGDSRYIHQTIVDKSCVRLAYGDFKDLPRKTASDNALRGKAFEIAKDPKYDGYQRGLASMVYKLLDKKCRKTVTFAKNCF